MGVSGSIFSLFGPPGPLFFDLTLFFDSGDFLFGEVFGESGGGVSSVVFLSGVGFGSSGTGIVTLSSGFFFGVLFFFASRGDEREGDLPFFDFFDMAVFELPSPFFGINLKNSKDE